MPSIRRMSLVVFQDGGWWGLRSNAAEATMHTRGISLSRELTDVARKIWTHAPGNAIGVMLILLPPTVTSSATLSASAATATTISLLCGAVCLVWYAVGPVIGIALVLAGCPLAAAEKRRQRRHITTVAVNEYQKQNTFATTSPAVAFHALHEIVIVVVRWLFEEKVRWIIDHRCRHPTHGPWSGDIFRKDPAQFQRRFTPLLAGYRGSPWHWYAAVDVVAPITMSILVSVPASVSGGSCTWVLWALFAVSVATCIGAVAVRPCMTRWDSVWSIVSNILALASAALCAASNDVDTATDVAAALAWITLVPAMASLMQLMHSIWLSILDAQSFSSSMDSFDTMSSSHGPIGKPRSQERIRRSTPQVGGHDEDHRGCRKVMVPTTAADSLAALIKTICSNASPAVWARGPQTN